MKKLLFLAIAPLVASAGDYTVYKAGVQQGTTYASEKTAILAAVTLSQACNGCAIAIKFETTVSVKPPACVSSSSSSSSAAYIPDGTKGATLSWQPPTQREDGVALKPEEITSYNIRYKLPTETDYKTIATNGTATSYEFTQNAKDLAFEISCVTGSLESEYTPMQVK